MLRAAVAAHLRSVTNLQAKLLDLTFVICVVIIETLFDNIVELCRWVEGPCYAEQVQAKVPDSAPGKDSAEGKSRTRPSTLGPTTLV